MLVHCTVIVVFEFTAVVQLLTLYKLQCFWEGGVAVYKLIIDQLMVSVNCTGERASTHLVLNSTDCKAGNAAATHTHKPTRHSTYQLSSNKIYRAKWSLAWFRRSSSYSVKPHTHYHLTSYRWHVFWSGLDCLTSRHVRSLGKTRVVLLGWNQFLPSLMQAVPGSVDYFLYNCDYLFSDSLCLYTGYNATTIDIPSKFQIKMPKKVCEYLFILISSV